MVAFQRDDLHRETARMLANGLIQSKNYNDVGLLSSQIIRPEQETTGRVQHQAERHYQYDKNYLLTQVEDSRLGQLNYQYDVIGRLIKSQGPQLTESFAFDPAGNLIDPIATQSSQVKNNLITQYQGKHYKYDAQGNVIETTQAGKTLKLTWDNLNRLIQSDNNGQVTTYGYDVFGRRLYKHSPIEKNLTLFGWDSDLMIWESQQSSNEQAQYTKHYVYEPNSFVPLLQTGYAGFIKLIETPDYSKFQTEPYSVYKDSVWKTETRKNKAALEKVTFYHCDQVGTPQTLSNELGECVWEIKQNTWGIALEIKASENLLEQTNIRFQGQYYDKETGLHYNRYRYYEPHSARYVSKDPIGLFGGLNNSIYVSDPNQWVDSMGLMAQGEREKVAANNALVEKHAAERFAQQKAAWQVSKIKDARSKQQNRPSTGILGALLPGTMSSVAKNKQDANVLRNQQGMRNVGTVGAAAATLPYGVTVISGGFGAGAKAPIMGAVGSAAVDGGFQTFDSVRCKCNAYNYKRTLGVAGVGALAGGVGANLAKANGVEYVTAMNFYKNTLCTRQK